MGETIESEAAEVRHIRHEINNALTGIIGHTQLLNLRGELNDKARARVEKIEELANRIRELAAAIE